MANLGGFNANNVKPNKGFDALPVGEYDAIIVASEMKPTNAGNGEYLNLTLQVLSGQYQNRKLWDLLNLKNPSQDAVDIAKGTLSAICRAVNVMEPNDSSELHNKPLRVRVKIDKDGRNKITSYKPRQAGGPAPVQTTAPSNPSNDRPNW